MKLKFCGIKNESDLKKSIYSNASLIGINFYKKSLRFIGNNFYKLIHKIPSYIGKVALFVNETKNNILNFSKYFDFFQFHGNETFSFCEFFKKKYIKTIHINNKYDFYNLKKKNNLFFILLDKTNENFGGSGFNYNQFKLINKIPTIVSGGINIINFLNYKKISSYKYIDICSSIEFKQLKNIKKMIKYI